MNPTGRQLAPFVALEAATALSGGANGVSMVAFPWFVLELTGSASSAAAIGAITLVPLLLSLSCRERSSTFSGGDASRSRAICSLSSVSPRSRS